ncbi:MAG: hypothetical protein AAF153_00525, partial [Pseudomonadota bacterium]
MVNNHPTNNPTQVTRPATTLIGNRHATPDEQLANNLRLVMHPKISLSWRLPRSKNHNITFSEDLGTLEYLPIVSQSTKSFDVTFSKRNPQENLEGLDTEPTIYHIANKVKRNFIEHSVVASIIDTENLELLEKSEEFDHAIQIYAERVDRLLNRYGNQDNVCDSGLDLYSFLTDANHGTREFYRQLHHEHIKDLENISFLKTPEPMQLSYEYNDDGGAKYLYFYDMRLKEMYKAHTEAFTSVDNDGNRHLNPNALQELNNPKYAGMVKRANLPPKTIALFNSYSSQTPEGFKYPVMSHNLSEIGNYFSGSSQYRVPPTDTANFFIKMNNKIRGTSYDEFQLDASGEAIRQDKQEQKEISQLTSKKKWNELVAGFAGRMQQRAKNSALSILKYATFQTKHNAIINVLAHTVFLPINYANAFDRALHDASIEHAVNYYSRAGNPIINDLLSGNLSYQESLKYLEAEQAKDYDDKFKLAVFGAIVENAKKQGNYHDLNQAVTFRGGSGQPEQYPNGYVHTKNGIIFCGTDGRIIVPEKFDGIIKRDGLEMVFDQGRVVKAFHNGKEIDTTKDIHKLPRDCKNTLLKMRYGDITYDSKTHEHQLQGYEGKQLDRVTIYDQFGHARFTRGADNSTDNNPENSRKSTETLAPNNGRTHTEIIDPTDLDNGPRAVRLSPNEQPKSATGIRLTPEQAAVAGNARSSTAQPKAKGIRLNSIDGLSAIPGDPSPTTPEPVSEPDTPTRPRHNDLPNDFTSTFNHFYGEVTNTIALFISKSSNKNESKHHKESELTAATPQDLDNTFNPLRNSITQARGNNLITELEYGLLMKYTNDLVNPLENPDGLGPRLHSTEFIGNLPLSEQTNSEVSFTDKNIVNPQFQRHT